MKLTVNRDLAEPEFLCHAFTSKQSQELIRSGTIQTGVPHINLGIMRDITVVIPPLSEQRAIAEALSDADALITSIEQLIAKKRAIKHGASQQLLTGKNRLSGFSGQWVPKALGDIGECLIGLTYRPSDVREHGTLVMRSSNIQDGRLAFDDNVFVETDIPHRIILRRDDILVCVRNGSRDLIGKSALIDDRAVGMAFGAFMAVFRSPTNRFVLHFFKSDNFIRQVNEHLGATINQITNKSLNSFKMLLPPTEGEQSAIAEVLSDMDAEIEALEAKLAKARMIKQGMMQELLTGRIRLV
jgi:type I restriction enzyme S subunit